MTCDAEAPSALLPQTLHLVRAPCASRLAPAEGIPPLPQTVAPDRLLGGVALPLSSLSSRPILVAPGEPSPKY